MRITLTFDLPGNATFRPQLRAMRRLCRHLLTARPHQIQRIERRGTLAYDGLITHWLWSVTYPQITAADLLREQRPAP